jgi:hypothetical protein
MGEKVDDLLPALIAFRDNLKDAGDGMWHSECTLRQEAFAPLARALMRIEARLLREDANRLSSEMKPWRTPDQRRYDAFMELITMLPRAKGTSRGIGATARR